MKRKPLFIVIPLLIAVIASAVLFSLRPLGYTAISGETVLQQTPPESERLTLDEEDCERLIRRALRRDGMISAFRTYTITLTCEHTVYFGEAAIFCIARVVDEDGFVFLNSYIIKRT